VEDGVADDSKPADGAPSGPQKKLAEAVAPRPTRQYRAEAFQAYVLIASAAFIALALGAHMVPYFAVDLKVTRAVQGWESPAFVQFMWALSWLGFVPQVDILGVAVIVTLYAAGLRWESVCALFAALGVGLGTVIKLIVYRPRPSADLVHVFRELPPSGFPSGHVLMFSAFGGFLIFLAFTLLKPSPLRTTLIVLFAAVVAFMGLSRISLGQHWFSDVMGAYVLGSLWLLLTIRIYRWGKPRFFAHQPVAREAQGARVS
jgi:membrane-associated phospholipid phosphatase